MSCQGQKSCDKCRSEYIKKEYFGFRVRRVSYLTMLQDHIDHLSRLIPSKTTQKKPQLTTVTYCNAMSILQPFNWWQY